MKVAVSTTGTTLSAAVDPRFGRCSTFLVVETDDGSWEAIDNSNAARSGGAGIQAAQLLANRGVKTVMTGSCGPNAYATLKAAGIDVYVGCTGSAAEAMEAYRQGRLEPAPEPNVSSHAGMKGQQR
jgi:predicted Fe-Mo cluster-binding NifX family protein